MNATRKLDILKMIIIRPILFFALLAALIFGAAGSFRFWQGWLFCAIFMIPGWAGLFYIYFKEPDLAARRMRVREKRGTQRSLIYWTYPYFLALFILPGLDYRFGWSHLPVWVVIAGAVLFLSGYAGFLWVLLTNRFAGRTVEVDREQKVITSGPYAMIRHPMYCADILIFVGSTLTLGSLPAVLLSLLVLPVLVLRILDEENALRQELSGYDEYCLKVRFRLLPGIW